jgi:hypothetical protein
VILCEPAAREEIVRPAAVPDITPLPILFAPSKNVTVPVVPDGKVAVKVTDWV